MDVGFFAEGGRIGTAGDVLSAHCDMAKERALSKPRHLLERDRELAEIDACIAAATAEEGSFLVLEGRAGMGKTALARRSPAAGRSGRVDDLLRGGSELEREFAFGVVRQLFEPAIGALEQGERARVLEGAAALAEPVLIIGGAPAAPDQFATLHGLYWLAANLAADTRSCWRWTTPTGPTSASLRWLAYLLNRLEGLPMLVAIATRPRRPSPRARCWQPSSRTRGSGSSQSDRSGRLGGHARPNRAGRRARSYLHRGLPASNGGQPARA